MRRILTLAALLALAATPALAHPGHIAGGFPAGFLHPYTGLDHMLAMSAVGLWAGLVFKEKAWIWPATFTSCMLIGFFYATAGGRMPFSEILIGCSVVGLGLAVGLNVRAPMLAGCALVALFAFAHGYAHGVEAPPGVPVAPFAAGFALATMSLHVIGIGAAALVRKLDRPMIGRIAGFAVAAAGVAILAAG